MPSPIGMALRPRDGTPDRVFASATAGNANPSGGDNLNMDQHRTGRRAPRLRSPGSSRPGPRDRGDRWVSDQVRDFGPGRRTRDSVNPAAKLSGFDSNERFFAALFVCAVPKSMPVAQRLMSEIPR